MQPASVNKVLVLEIVDSVFRSWWTLVAGICLGTAAAIVALRFVPPVYEAGAEIHAATEKLSQGFVPETAADDPDIRLREIQEQVQSEAQLRNLFADRLTPERQEEDLERLASRIRLEWIGRGYRFFRISFQDSDPVFAAGIAKSLSRMYIEENSRIRSGRAGETTETLREIANGTQTRLNELEAKRAAFLAEHPDAVGVALDSVRDELRRRQVDLDQNLARQAEARRRIDT